MARAVVGGPGYLWRGFGLIRQPGLRRYAALPILIALLAFASLIGVGIHFFDALLEWMLPTGDAWWVRWLRNLLWPLFALAVTLVLFFSFTLVANLIAAPFNGLLAEKVEARLRGESLADTGGVMDALKDFLPAMFNELRKFSYYLVWAIPLLLLFIIPGINIVAPILWTVFMAWMLALEYVEYPMENHRIRFKQVRRRLGQRRLLGLGFGAAVMGVTLIPLLNLLVMPAAVAGATALWLDQLQEPTSPTDA